MDKIYFDYAATTPIDPEVMKATKPYLEGKFGNPSSLHFFGQEAISAIDGSRETIANAISADFREIIFTGSATEANNLVLRGLVKQFSFSKDFQPRIIISSIEHESVLETARDLENFGVDVVYLPVQENGIVDLEILKRALNDRTILVSIMYANNEIGIIQPIKEISKIIKDFRKEKNFPLFHTDAVQAFQYLDCGVKNLSVDLMTLSAHKIYGPKGIGVLYAKNLKLKNYLQPVITGGGQEFGFRSGTENVPAIVGFGKAVELVVQSKEKELKRISELSNYFLKELKKIFPKIEVNGSGEKTSNILNIYFPKQTAEDLLIKLDMLGIAVSSGSACSVRSSKPSHVLRAMGFKEERIRGSIRFSFGRFTIEKEVKEALKRLKTIFNFL